MRRLYVCPKSVWKQHLDCFHPAIGSHYIDLGDPDDPDGLILISTDFMSEAGEDKWHEHPEVAVLPDATFEGTTTVDELNQESKYAKVKGDKHPHALKKVKQKHVDALKKIGVTETDTILDISNKAKKIHPLVKIKHTI